MKDKLPVVTKEIGKSKHYNTMKHPWTTVMKAEATVMMLNKRNRYNNINDRNIDTCVWRLMTFVMKRGAGTVVTKESGKAT